MKPTPMSYLYEHMNAMEEGACLAVGMEVDDADPVDVLGEIERPPIDADFFNSFEDDFDDSDV